MTRCKVEVKQFFGITTLDVIASDIVQAQHICLSMTWRYDVEILGFNEVKK